MRPEEICVLIPSLEPDDRLPAYVDTLLNAGFGLVVVINDGSGAAYDGIFEQVAGKPRCLVLRHDRNFGKGRALRTGVAYIRDETAFDGVITADADGQHTARDTLLLAEKMDAGRRELLLGARDFSRRNKSVPPKSRFGNRSTSVVFALLYGRWLPDTQTGLRGFGRDCFDALLDTGGDRFEYEMNVLVRFTQMKIPFVAVPIQTIYHDENKGTHFHPIRDSWRIYKLLLGSFFRFSAASILSCLLDYAVLSALMWWAFRDVGLSWRLGAVTLGVRELIATPAARLCSAPVNFLLNRNFSFRVKNCPGAAWRYALLCLGVLVLTTFLFAWLNHFIPAHREGLSILLKVLIDVVLYLLNFRLQRNWVFGGGVPGDETEAAR